MAQREVVPTVAGRHLLASRAVLLRSTDERRRLLPGRTKTSSKLATGRTEVQTQWATSIPNSIQPSCRDGRSHTRGGDCSNPSNDQGLHVWKDSCAPLAQTRLSCVHEARVSSPLLARETQGQLAHPAHEPSAPPCPETNPFPTTRSSPSRVGIHLTRSLWERTRRHKTVVD